MMRMRRRRRSAPAPAPGAPAPQQQGPRLAPQRSNPGTNGSNVRYDLRGFPVDENGLYFDGTYHYQGDVDNALSTDRPDSVVAGLFPADDERSRGSQWQPGQPRPNQGAPRLIGQASRMAQQRRYDMSTPYGRAAARVSPLVEGSAAALIEALLGKSSRAVREIDTRTGSIASSVAPYAGKAAGYYGDATRQTQGVGDAVSAAIRATGNALQGDISGKLAGIQAPGQAVDTFGAGQARTGDAAANAVAGLSSADVERLKGTGDAASTMMGALPRIANLAGDTQRRGVLNQLGGELTDKLAELYAKEPGMILDALDAERDAELAASKQRSLEQYRQQQLGLSRQRVRQGDRRLNISQRQGQQRLDQSSYRLRQGDVRLAQGQARLELSRLQADRTWQNQLASLGIRDKNSQISASRNQLAWEKFRRGETPQTGAYTKSQIGKLKQNAGQFAREAFNGYWALDDDPDTPLSQKELLQMMRAQDVASPLQIEGVGQYQRSYQEAMTYLLDQGTPLVMAQAALNRYWTKPGDPRPNFADKQGSGRPRHSFQERNPGKAPAAANGGLQLPASFRSTHPTDGLSGYPAQDIMSPPGTPVLSPVSGTVVRWGSAQGGEALYLDDDDPDREPDFWIGHIDGRVPVGTRVRRGQRIANVSRHHPRPHVHIGRRV